MRKIFLIPLLSLVAISASSSPSATGHQPFSGVYKIYSGELDDSGTPTRSDKKVMFSVDGKAAKNLFDAIGPDVKDECTDGTGVRVRAKDADRLVCTRSEEGEYACNFGFDLKTGKSIGAIVC